MAELKKCPFCGGEAEYEVFNDGFFTWGRVECKQCGAMITTPPVNTIEAWNNRATEADIRAMALDEVLAKVNTVNLWDSRDKEMFRLVVEQLKERE